MKIFVAIGFFIFTLISCEIHTYEDISEEATVEDTLITYNQHIQPVVNQKCIQCHSPGNQAEHQPFETYEQVSSRIEDILFRIQLPDGDPNQMPLEGDLSSAQIQLFILWDEQGLLEE